MSDFSLRRSQTLANKYLLLFIFTDCVLYCTVSLYSTVQYVQIGLIERSISIIIIKRIVLIFINLASRRSVRLIFGFFLLLVHFQRILGYLLIYSFLCASSLIFFNFGSFRSFQTFQINIYLFDNRFETLIVIIKFVLKCLINLIFLILF